MVEKTIICATCKKEVTWHKASYISELDICHLRDMWNFIRAVQVNSIQKTFCFDCFIIYNKELVA